MSADFAQIAAIMKAHAGGNNEQFQVSVRKRAEALFRMRERTLEAHLGPMVGSIHRLRRYVRRRICKDCNKALRGILNDLMGRHLATSAWLFIKESERHVCARVTCNTNRHDFCMKILSKRGIVPKVARTKVAEWYGDVNDRVKCPHYLSSNRGTQSEVTVPILSHGRLLGVLNLESRTKNQFSEDTCRAIQKEVAAFVPHLLCLEVIKRRSDVSWPWHPAYEEPSLAKSLADICDVIATTIHPDKASCTIWNADWNNKVLFPLATSRFQERVRGDDMIPLDGGHTSQAVRLPRGEWLVVPGSDPRLADRPRLQALGLTKLITTPIYLPGTPQLSAAGALNVYLYEDQHGHIKVGRAELARAAWMIGQYISSHRAIREDVTAASLEHSLLEDSWDGNQFRTLNDVLTKSFSLDGCTVYVFFKEWKVLLGLAYSDIQVLGNECEAPVFLKSIENRPFVLSLDEVNGDLRFLVDHPGAIIRRHLVSTAGGLGDALPTRERRFLGMSVERNGETLGIVRLGRCDNRPPFAEWDEYLLKRLTDIWQPHVGRWMDVNKRGLIKELSSLLGAPAYADIRELPHTEARCVANPWLRWQDEGGGEAGSA